MSKELENELIELEKCFKKNGYTDEMIEEVKMQGEAETIEDFVENLDEERSCWGCPL